MDGKNHPLQKQSTAEMKGKKCVYQHQTWMWDAWKEITKEKIRNGKMNKYELGWVPEFYIITFKKEIEKENETSSEDKSDNE